MDHVVNMGKPQDMKQHKTLACIDDVTHCNRVTSARESIYEKDYTVDSTPVEHLLKKDSLVPSSTCLAFFPQQASISGNGLLFQNTFSGKLVQFGFCFYGMLIVDLMHKFELGVWKAVFIHLLRFLDCQHETLKYELDRR